MSLTSLGSILSTARSDDTSVPLTSASTNVLVFSSKLTETLLGALDHVGVGHDRSPGGPPRSRSRSPCRCLPSGWPNGDSPPPLAAADALRAHEHHALALVAVDVRHRAGRVRAAVVDGPGGALGDGGLARGCRPRPRPARRSRSGPPPTAEHDEAAEQAGEEVAAAARLGIGRCHDRCSRPPALNGHKWRQPARRRGGKATNPRRRASGPPPARQLTPHRAPVARGRRRALARPEAQAAQLAARTAPRRAPRRGAAAARAAAAWCRRAASSPAAAAPAPARPARPPRSPCGRRRRRATSTPAPPASAASAKPDQHALRRAAAVAPSAAAAGRPGVGRAVRQRRVAVARTARRADGPRRRRPRAGPGRHGRRAPRGAWGRT